MQTIETKYHASGRVSATTSNGVRVYVDYDSTIDTFANHVAACKKLMAKVKWQGILQAGHTKRGYLFVFVDEKYIIEVK